MSQLKRQLLRNRLQTAFVQCGLLSLGLALFCGCVNQILSAKGSKDITKNEEYDQAVNIHEIKVLPNATPSPLLPSGDYVRFPGDNPDPQPWWPKRYRKLKRKRKAPPVTALSDTLPSPSPSPSPVLAVKREPPSEDSEGFTGRRPTVDPFHVGEKVTLDVSYFGVSAGDITIEVLPYVEVNGRRSYKFVGHAISTSVFAVFYAVDDWFETFVDYESLIPSSYELHVKETKQLRETRAVFDWGNSTATWWDKKINSEKKVEEQKKEWEIPAYSQNVFSIFYYLRTFTLVPGKKLAFRLAHENENLTVTAEVLRRETITTEAGEFETVVVKPKIELNGVFKPVGDIFLWLTDDDRKLIVRMESKIKIGTIVGVAKKVEMGR